MQPNVQYVSTAPHNPFARIGTVLTIDGKRGSSIEVQPL